MGIRFRKSLRIMPGVKLNLSKSGVSTSVGRPGAAINLGPRGSRATVGVPGTGLSYNTPLHRGTGSAGDNRPAQGCLGANGCAVLIVLLILLALVSMCSSTPGAVDNTQSNVGEAAETAYATAKAVNCRAEPSKVSAVRSVLRSGDNAPVVDRRDGWTKLDVPAGACWVSSSLLSATAPAASFDTSSVQSLVGSSVQSSERVSRPRSRPMANSGSHRSSARHRQRSRDSYNSEGCPCSGSNVCIGPRGGRYCITSGGNKRYGV